MLFVAERDKCMCIDDDAIDESDGTNLHKILQRDLTTSQEEELNVIKDYVEGRPAILLPENYVGGRFQRLGNPPNSA